MCACVRVCVCVSVCATSRHVTCTISDDGGVRPVAAPSLQDAARGGGSAQRRRDARHRAAARRRQDPLPGQSKIRF